VNHSLPARRQRQVKPADVREDEILDATEAALLDGGEGGLKIDDVAGRAGVAVGTVYRYFDSKDRLVAAARRRYAQRWTDAIADAIDVPDTSGTDRLDLFLDTVFDYGVRTSDLHHALFAQPGGDERQAFAPLEAMLHDLLDDGLNAGEFDAIDAGAAATYIFNGLHGLLVDAVRSRQQRRANDLARQLVRQTLNITG
jgi:AcrR family transcriptional regulator